MRGGGKIQLGRVAGVSITLSTSWFVIAAVITFLYAAPASRVVGPGLPAYAGGFAFAVLLALSVLAHEAAHAVAARSFGLAVDEIVVDLWGGHTSLGAPRTPLQAAVVSVVAPLSNIAIAGLMLGIRQAAQPSGIVGFLLEAVLLANLLVGLFNLLPGLPLDGGRVAEALIWAVTGDRDRGTEVAGWGGRVVVVVAAFVVIGLPLLLGGAPGITSVVWIVLLGAMLWRSAGEAIRVSRARRKVRGLDLGLIVAPVAVVSASASVADWRRSSAALADDRAVGVLLSPDGRPVAVVDRDAAAAVPDHATASTPLRAAATPLGEGAVAPPGAGPLEVAEVLSRVGGPGVVVVRRDGSGGLVPVGWVSGVALARAIRPGGRTAA